MQATVEKLEPSPKEVIDKIVLPKRPRNMNNESSEKETRCQF
jgi:hypothetical protein